MQRKKITKILFMTIITALVLIMSSNISFASDKITPDVITGRGPDTIQDVEDFKNNVLDVIGMFGTFLAIGILMVIGIRYVTGSIEEKANYKKSMMPYVVGCVILWGASNLAPQIRELFEESTVANTQDFWNKLLGIIQVFGTIISVGALIILGLKYMTGSLEQRASYKKTMLPFLIGSIFIFAAVNATSVIYNAVTGEVSMEATRQQNSDDVAGILDGTLDLTAQTDDKIKQLFGTNYIDSDLRAMTQGDPRAGGRGTTYPLSEAISRLSEEKQKIYNEAKRRGLLKEDGITLK